MTLRSLVGHLYQAGLNFGDLPAFAVFYDDDWFHEHLDHKGGKILASLGTPSQISGDAWFKFDAGRGLAITHRAIAISH